MPEQNQFFRPVRDFCQRTVVTCSPADPLVAVVGIMREKNISSVVVVEEGQPIGIFTDRDLRNKVVAGGLDPARLDVRAIMNAPLSVIAEDDLLYQALYRMSRQKIHRLGVVDAGGRLSGIITDTDILRLQAHSPHQLVLDIEQARSVDDLKALHARIQALVVHLSGTGMGIRDLTRLIAHLNDQIVLRLIALLRAGRFADLPDGFAFLVLGSEGRGEQTLATDQDNAIVYDDALDTAAVARIEAFAQALIDDLVAIGIPPCPGGIMASNPEWRRSLSQWHARLEHWMATPTPDNILACSTFVDLRTLYGDPSFERRLKERIYGTAREQRLYLMRMVENGLRFAPPLGWFGKIKGERDGAHEGELDLKKAGIFAITDGIKALAIEGGLLDGSTAQRLDALRAAGTLKGVEAENVEESFAFLVQMRLRAQVEALRAGRAPDNYLALDQLNAMEQGRLRIALTSVEKFQGFIKHHFGLHLMR